MRDAIVVEAVRSPLGKRNGGLARLHPAVLSAAVLSEAHGLFITPGPVRALR